MDEQKILILAGPTASGKTELALGLSRALGAEIVSADSRQVYRDFNAGTAKPPRGTHHLVDCADPRETFDAGLFAAAAREAISGIRGRGRVAIVCGGTGLYLKALLDGFSTLPKPGAMIRKRLVSEAEKVGKTVMHARLKAVDPTAADRIPQGNIQRILRALEVYEAGGRPLSSYWAEGRTGGIASESRFVFTIQWPVDELNRRIEIRARAMWDDLLAEVKDLRGKGFTGNEPAFQSLGYREALETVNGLRGKDEGLQALILSTKQYAKRQRTWFRTQLKPDAVIEGGTPKEMLRQALEAYEAAAR